jgi:hypothetical protein
MHADSSQRNRGTNRSGATQAAAMRYAARRTSIDGHRLALATHTHTQLLTGGARRETMCGLRCEACAAVLRHRSTIPTQPVFSKLSIDGRRQSTSLTVQSGCAQTC